jgi:hypothetical protein
MNRLDGDGERWEEKGGEEEEKRRSWISSRVSQRVQPKQEISGQRGRWRGQTNIHLACRSNCLANTRLLLEKTAPEDVYRTYKIYDIDIKMSGETG